MDPHGGQQDLALLAGSADAEVVLPWNLSGQGTAAISLWVKGVEAQDQAFSNEFLNLAGAAVALVTENAGQARVWVLASDAAGNVAWQPTGALVAIAGNGTLADWTQLQVGIDFGLGTWSLTIGGQPAVTGLGLAANPAVGRSCRAYGYPDKTWWLDDCRLDASTPVNAAGQLAVEEVLPANRRRIPHPLPGASSSSASAGPSGSSTPPLPATSSVSPKASVLSSVIYVDATKGDDNGDGSLQHPKSTLRAAFAALNPSGATVHVAAGTYWLETKVFPAVRFIAEGRVVIQ